MADERDFRVKLDIAFGPDDAAYAKELIQLVLPYLRQGQVLSQGLGYVQNERCGHRLGVACTITDKWEVGVGKVV